MKKNLIVVIIFIISALYTQAFGQAQEIEKKFKYQEWRFLYEDKCSKCHTLERIFAEPKTENEWRICVTRMMRKTPLWITPEESAQIIEEIIGTRKDVIIPHSVEKTYHKAELLFIDRCTKCHTLTQILNKDKTREEWHETVLRMRDNAPELFREEDIKILVDYITERGNMVRDDVAATIMVDKCLICHEWGRILLERKSRRDWEKCVTDMRRLARETFKKDWFTHDEFNAVVDLLVKTQGLEMEGG